MYLERESLIDSILIFLLVSGTTEAKRTDIADTFLDLGRNLFPDNLFQAAFQSVKSFSMFLTALLHLLTVARKTTPH